MSFGSTSTLTRSLDRLVGDHERRPAGADRDDLLRQARVIREEAGILDLPGLVGVAALREGEVLLAAGDLHGALGALQASVDELERAGSADLLAVALGRTSEALVATGALRPALDVCARGIALVERDRGKTSAAYMQASYLRRTISLYANGVLAAHQLGDPRMLEWIELTKGHALPAATRPAEAERERLAQLGERIDDCRARGDVDAEAALRARRRVLFDRLLGVERAARPSFDLEAVQAGLAPGRRALSYYWIGATRLLVVVVSPTDVASHLQAVTTEERETLDRLAEHVLHTAGSVEYHVRSSVVDGAVKRISALLLPDAVREALAGAERLAVSPHRILHAVPLLALQLDGEPLVRRMPVAAIPNLTCLQPRPHAPASRRVLAVGVNEYRGARPLPAAEEAAAEVASLYAAGGFEADALLGASASELALRRRLADPGSPPACLHLTLHGASLESDTPLESWLLLADSRLDGLDLVDWRLPGSTVVLASCSSGQRAVSGRGMRELPGDDLFGLQAAFFAAGAHQVLSALWPVDFPVARSVTRSFHRGMIAGEEADVALRRAVVEHLDTAGVRDRGSAYWAPFLLTSLGAPTAIGRPA